MTNKELTSVAIKVFAIYVLVQAILSVPLLVNAMATYGFSEHRSGGSILLWLLGAAAFILLVGLTVFLWKLATRVATQASAQVEDGKSSKVDDGFLISLLGLYLTFEGLLRFGYTCTSLYIQNQSTEEYSAQTLAYVIGYLIQVVIGLSLILKAHGWLALLRWLREAGLKGKL